MDDQVDPQNLNKQDENGAPIVNQPNIGSDVVQQNQGGTVWPQAQNPQVSQQGLAQSYNEPQQTGVQPISASPSPEVPARVEASGERIVVPELSKESSEQKVEQQKSEEISQESSVEAPKETPDQKKFESPFNVYGYKVSSQISDIGKKIGDDKVSGDTNSSKTWLVVLLNRLLKMYRQGDSLNTAEK